MTEGGHRPQVAKIQNHNLGFSPQSTQRARSRGTGQAIGNRLQELQKQKPRINSKTSKKGPKNMVGGRYLATFSCKSLWNHRKVGSGVGSGSHFGSGVLRKPRQNHRW